MKSENVIYDVVLEPLSFKGKKETLNMTTYSRKNGRLHLVYDKLIT